MHGLLARIAAAAAVATGIVVAWAYVPNVGRSAAVAAPQAPAAPEDHGFSAAADREALWVGVAGCASTACHHQNGPRGTLHSEYSTWAGYDRHAQAFQVLYNDRSERIARNLPDEQGRFVAAHENKLCLKCHASHDGVTDRGVDERFALADGVGCESCHGAAEKWLTTHYQEGFKSKTLEEKAALGLRPTKDLVYRAKLCAECHIGDEHKEVNHDLIAAGHPRLSFEYAAYLGIYEKHWSHADELARYPDFEARAWAVGQVVSARAALQLLESRATEAQHDKKPWPEFSEYGCFACHQDLTVSDTKSKSQIEKYAGRRPGSMPWGTWYLTMTTDFAGAAGVELNHGGASLEEIRKAMEESSPDAALVAGKIKPVVRTLDGWLARLQEGKPLDAAEIKAMMKRFASKDVDQSGALDWDQSTQIYLALAALHQGLADGNAERPAALYTDLRLIGNQLKTAFPKGSDSPSKFNSAKKQEFGDRLKAIRQQLGN